MTNNVLADLKATLRGELITRADEEAFTAARYRGFNHDLNAHANPLGFVIASGVRDAATTVNYCRYDNQCVAHAEAVSNPPHLKNSSNSRCM